jgi:chaperonin GroES
MITPLFDFVILLPDAVEKQQSGIFLPDESQKRPNSGTVVALGKGVQAEDTGEWIQMQVKVGDRVTFSRLSGGTIDLEGVEHYMMRQTDLLAIL